VAGEAVEVEAAPAGRASWRRKIWA